MPEDEPTSSAPPAPAPAAPPEPSPPGANAQAPAPKPGWRTPGTRARRLVVALGIYAVCTVVFAVVAGDRLTHHTAYNHFALLADAWLHGRQDLANGSPAYAQGNDFAQFEGKTYISFPPFPAVLMLPFVAASGSPENFRDAQFMVWLAGLGPALLFLVLEKLRRTGRSPRSERENAALALLFAFGTVYFFTAVEGTVWFAALVVGVALAALYALYALDAERPFVAGLALACAWMTRTPLLLAVALFALEAVRVATPGGIPCEGTFLERVKATVVRVDKRALAKSWAIFAAPILVSLAIASWMNFTRFHNPSPTAFGHEYLSVVWAARMKRWGLFGFHYLAKNLGVMLTILPWLPAKGDAWRAPFRINEHGLALWFTTPVYFWLFWPKKRGFLWGTLVLTAAPMIVMELLYQNSGWRQFGYRFSNDYAVFLFMLLAIGARPMGKLFWAAGLWGIAWNTFGAVTFDRGEYDAYYFREGTQEVLYQSDMERR